MKFIPIKRSDLKNIEEGTKVFRRDGSEFTFESFDDTDEPLALENEVEGSRWYKLGDFSLFNTKKTGGNSMEQFKQYLEKNRDMFFTIGLVLLLDHFIFGGAFREKLKAIVDGFLDQKTKAISNGKA